MIANKNKFRLLIPLILLMGISIGVSYFANIRSPQIEKIEQLREINTIKKAEIQSLEGKIGQLATMQEELIDFKLEIEALKNKIPRHKNTIIIMMEILKVMDAYDFEDTQIIMGDPIKEESNRESYSRVPMTINYTTTYYNVAKLLEKISRSYHMVTIDSFTIDNSIQDQMDGAENKIISGQYVRAQIVLSLHYIQGEKEEEYPNFMEFLNKNENVFLRLNKEEIVESN